MAARAANLISPSDHKIFNRYMADALRAEMTYVNVIKEWPKNKDAAYQIQIISKAVRDMIPVIIRGVDDPKERAKIVQLLNVVLTTVDLAVGALR